MAEIRAFKGIRYDPATVLVEAVVTQPYDKITPEMQAVYYEASPYSAVRLVLGRTEPGDDDTANVYTRAAGFFGRWLDEQVLVEDARPAIYASGQRFEIEGRTVHRRGFVALVKLEPFGTGVIYPHERTFKKYTDDRLRLMRATRANFGHVFMLYSDAGRTISRMLEELEGRGTPEVAVEALGERGALNERGALGVRHTLSAITDPEAIGTICEVMADKQLFIADGHHRYETAVNYRDEMRAAHGEGGAYDWRMVTLVNMEDEGLVVRPTHRLVRNLAGFDPAQAPGKLAPFFRVEACSLEALPARIRPDDEGQPRLGLYTGGESAFVLTLADRGRLAEVVGHDTPRPVLELDVTVLHGLILEHVFGLSREAQNEVGNIRYVAGFGEGVEGVRSGTYQAAFFLNPTRVSQVRAVATSGSVMPQKSTDFYPKLLTGLVMRRIAG